MAPPKLHLLKPSSVGLYLEMGSLRRQLRLKEVMRVGPDPVRRETPGCVCTEEDHATTGRREPRASQGERPQETSDASTLSK